MNGITELSLEEMDAVAGGYTGLQNAMVEGAIGGAMIGLLVGGFPGMVVGAIDGAAAGGIVYGIRQISHQ